MSEEFNDKTLNLEIDTNNGISGLKYQIMQLTKENEHYKQEVYSLQSKIQVELEIHHELQETIDKSDKAFMDLKDEMNKKIKDIEEKNGIIRNEFILRINEMEHEIIDKSKKIYELEEKLTETNKLLEVMTSEKQSKDISIHEETISQQLNELLEKLAQEENTCRCLKQTIDTMSKEKYELEEILEITKTQLTEQKQLLNSTRDELNECRIELESLKNTPTNEMSKGNSLFAEVEDRRKKLYDRMEQMKKYYYEAKQCVNNKDREIKTLKYELAALLNEKKNDTIECIQEHGEMLNKYKDTIFELENKYSELQKKYRKLEIQKQPTDNSFSYFQTLLDMKRKEIEELELKLEKKSIQSLMDEGIKHKTNREMRHWRNKAMSYEAQIETIKNQFENIQSSEDIKQLSKMLRIDYTTKMSTTEEIQIDLNEKIPPIMNKNVIIDDKSIEIPKILLENIDHDEKIRKTSSITSIEDILFDLSDSNISDQTIDIKEIQNNKLMKGKQFNKLNSIENKENEPSSSSIIITNNNDDNQEKEKKILRFAEGTVDPEPRKLRRQNTPKYPIIHVSNTLTDE